MKMDKKKGALLLSFLLFLGFGWIAYGVHSVPSWLVEIDYY